MSPIKRAFHYFTRKTTHSAIMVLILTAISILIFTVLSTTVTANHYIQQIKNSFSKNITLSSYHSTDVLTPENILKIADMADIVNYKCLSNTLSASLLNSAEKPFDVYTKNDTLVSEGFEHAGTIRSNTSSEQDELFVDGTFELVKGRHLNKNDKGKALIHRNLAESNGLSVGDIIKLDFPKEIITDLSRDYDTASMNLKPIKVEIVGIFQTAQSVDESSRLQLSHLLYENNCYIDRNTYASFFGLNGNTFFHKVTFTISNSAELTNVVSTIQNLKWIDWSTCNIWSDMNEYGPTIDALSSLNDLLQIGLLLILLVCLLILILIISYGVKRRKKEIGILLALGITPNSIVLQHITEALLSTIVAILLSIILSGGIVRSGSNYLLSNTIHQTTENGSASHNESGTLMTNSKLTLSYTTVWSVTPLEFALVTISVIVVSVPFMHKKPNELIKI